jgi:hypothetical protein
MKTGVRHIFTQPILVVIVIFVILVGFGAIHLIQAQTLPVRGMVNAKISCAELAARDFSKIPNAATKIT